MFVPPVAVTYVPVVDKLLGDRPYTKPLLVIVLLLATFPLAVHLLAKTVSVSPKDVPAELVAQGFQ